MCAITQNTSEWLAFRKDKLGASDAPIILGVSPWTTPYQLFQRKLGLIPEQEETDAMRRGRDIEEQVTLRLWLDKGLMYVPVVKIHAEYPWMIASLDGYCEATGEYIEIKGPGYDDHQKALQGEIPEKYYPQLQHQLAVTGAKSMKYISSYKDDDVTVEVFRDNAYIENLILKEQEFYQCLQCKTPPELTERDYVIRSDLLFTDTAQKWIEATEKLKELQDIEKMYRDQLIAMSKDTNSIGGGVKIQKVVRKGNIDYDKIPELQHVNLDLYRKNSISSWRITSNAQ